LFIVCLIINHESIGQVKNGDRKYTLLVLSKLINGVSFAAEIFFKKKLKWISGKRAIRNNIMSNILKSKFLLGTLILAAFVVTTATADAAITSTLKKGSRGSQVTELQTALGVTPVTGYFGNITKAAVMAFQTSKGLKPDGVFGAKSRGALGGAAVVPGTPAVPGTPLPTPVSGAVTVSLASDSPNAGTLLIDNTTGVMQNAAPIAKFVFSNGTGVAVNVNTVKLTRTGIAADGDINNLYLYEGANKLAELSSVSTKVFSFNSSGGLFSIPANSSKAIWVGVSMAVATSGPNSVGFTLNAASDVVLSNSVTVGGAFPIRGSEFKTAFITDLGYIDLTSVLTFPATLDPKAEAQELWRFTATANSQKMAIKRIVMTMVGTTSPGDIQDLMLTVGGVQVGATAQIGTDNKVVFDWSATPYNLLSGQNKVFVLMGKVVKGTGRAFKFTIRSSADFASTDMNYNVDTAALKNAAALTVVDPDSTGDGTNINNGTLTISRAANSPSGNVATGALDVPLARFDYRANGEDIKVSYVRVSVDNSQNVTMNDGKLYFNGSQVGTTDDSVADLTDNVFSLGNTVIIPAGTTGVFEYRANIEQDTGTDLVADGTIVASLSSGTSGDAVGQTSLTSLTPSASTGQTLTIKSGALSVAVNAGVPDATTTNTSGVRGATNVKVASFILTAGAGEPVNVTQLVVGDEATTSATSDFGANFQNLTLRNGASNSTPLATVQGTLSTTEGANYTFSLSPSITIPAGGQYVVDVYADILTTAISGGGAYAAAEAGLDFVGASATGVNTSSDATAALVDGTPDLQKVVISASGALTVTANAATPVAGQLVMGETGQTLAIFDFAASSAEDVDVSVIVLTDTSKFAGSFGNIKLYAQGISDPIGTVSSFDIQANGTATFNLSSDWTILKNLTKTLTVKADVNAYGSAVSGGTHVANLANATSTIIARGHASGVAIAETITSATGTQQDVYRTRVLADKVPGLLPGGASVVGANSSVLEFTVAANSGYDAVVKTVAVTMAGSANMTSSGDAKLYKSTDLSTALATEAYKAATAATGGTTTTYYTGATCDAGIPVGATVRIAHAGGATYMSSSGGYEITSITSANTCTYTFTPAANTAVISGDLMFYRPMQTGTGKVYFGSETTLTADVVNSDTDIDVASTKGFAVGDILAMTGFTSGGVATTVASGCAVTFIPDGDTLTTTACVLTPTTGLSYNYLSNTGATTPAITNYHNSAAVVYANLINTSGQTVAAGTPMTFVVKGDTTSQGTAAANLGAATTSSTLQASIAAIADMTWTDKLNYGITTVTKNLPIVGNTLTYTY
jgi:peptidoglycan hydrolase-like protein with peptidoglycan-binding domain